MKTKLLIVALVGISMFIYSVSDAQQKKQVNQQCHAWLSMNSNTRLTDKWGLIADVHVRRTNFMADHGFCLVRTAVNYRVKENMFVALGYGHMWIAPTGHISASNENRVYQQFQVSGKLGKLGITQRLMNEQRWHTTVIHDQPGHDRRFSNRIRYMNYATIPISSNKRLPSVAICEEIFLQFGKHIVNNTFDQNWFFIGIKQPVTSNFSFDIGYMHVFQQKSSGYQYDANNTFRLFMFYSPDLRKQVRKWL